MKRYFFILIIVLLTFSCNERTSEYAIIKVEPSNVGRFANTIPTDISEKEIMVLEKILKNCISNYNSDLRKEFATNKEDLNYQELKIEHYLIEDFSNYKRQYVPVINEDGEKVVWVNFFCSAGNWNWRNVLLGVNDGGNCYLNMTVNLNTGTCYDVHVNGYA